jgi:crotonobetainyl-CoA:carnitine CoA-transferase CaiB-like acyl-CoA transferase
MGEQHPTGALAGVRVVELATLYAAPLVGAILGDLGADVVKIEPPEGDAMRTMGVSRDSHSLVWAYVGRNKRSVVLDARVDDDRATLHALLARADVVVANQSQSVLAGWRCTYDELVTRNPGVVMIEMTGYGLDGPFGGRPGNGTMSEAFGGTASMIGDADGPPMLPSFPLGDTLAAWQGALGAVAALYARSGRGGAGQRVEVAMYEPVLALLATSVVGWRPGDAPPLRNGSRVEGAVPRNCYRTADDRYVVISGPTDAQVARMLELIGRSSEEDIARFGRATSRMANSDELDALVAEWARSRVLEDVIAAMDEARIPVSPVNDLAMLHGHPQVHHRQSLQTIHDPRAGDVTMPAPLPTLLATPPTIRTTGPALGAHTSEVLEAWLGTEPSY